MGRTVTAKINAKWMKNLVADKLAHGNEDPSQMEDLRVVTIESFAQAVEIEKACHKFRGYRADRKDVYDEIMGTALTGDPAKLKIAMAQSDSMIDHVIAFEPRLARRNEWTRGEDGIFADAGLVASGDDSPCYQMVRAEYRDMPASGLPINVVISTDSCSPSKEALTAFITTVRLVQQFRPVNVFWQGAWLDDSGKEVGYVFLSPLVKNDMDFSRVQFVLTSGVRDCLSFDIKAMQAQKDYVLARNCSRRADRSYMADAKFLDHDGIENNPEDIARTACRWLGWESPYTIQYRTETAAGSALQAIPKVWPQSPARTKAEIEADAKSNKEYYERRAQERKTEAANRMKVIQGKVMG